MLCTTVENLIEFNYTVVYTVYKQHAQYTISMRYEQNFNGQRNDVCGIHEMIL